MFEIISDPTDVTMVSVSQKCICGAKSLVNKVPVQGLLEYLEQNVNIKKALPTLSLVNRVTIETGLCPKCMLQATNEALSVWVLVEVHNNILGDSVFWHGPATDIDKIGNVVARDLAREVIRTGEPQTSGMWTVSISGESSAS